MTIFSKKSKDLFMDIMGAGIIVAANMLFYGTLVVVGFLSMTDGL